MRHLTGINAGAPCFFTRNTTKFAGWLSLAPITAIVRFAGRKASSEFVDSLKTERVTLNKRTLPLAADFHAPMALLIARERPERVDFSAVMNPEAHENTIMLCRCSNSIPRERP